EDPVGLARDLRWQALEGRRFDSLPDERTSKRKMEIEERCMALDERGLNSVLDAIRAMEGVDARTREVTGYEVPDAVSRGMSAAALRALVRPPAAVATDARRAQLEGLLARQLSARNPVGAMGWLEGQERSNPDRISLSVRPDVFGGLAAIDPVA